MPLLQTPLLEICKAVESQTIKQLPIQFAKEYCVGVVLASHNYPFGHSTPYPITIQSYDENLGEVVFGGVSEDKQGRLLASGGRVMLAVGYAKSLPQARENAYKILEAIEFEGRIYRDDIANKAL